MNTHDLIIHQAERIMKLSFTLEETPQEYARDIAEELLGISQSLTEEDDQINNCLNKIEASLDEISQIDMIQWKKNQEV